MSNVPITAPFVFVLDDDSQFLELLHEVLLLKSLHSVCFQTADALFSYHLPTNGVLILDLRMPDVDGIEVIRQLAERDIHFDLVLISGFDNRVLHSAKQYAEAHSFRVLCTLQKPLNGGDFEALVQAIKASDAIGTVLSEQSVLISKEELQSAIRERQLCIHYQPQHCMKSNRLLGFEALVRWKHPTLGLLYPNSFILLAEYEGLMPELSAQVCQMVFRTIKSHSADLGRFCVSINISSKDIECLTLPEQLESIAEFYSVPPENINIELTETSVMENMAPSLDVLNRIRMKNFQLAIDDFGTGHSSLSKLYRGPFSELKIDRSFVGRMSEDVEASAIVSMCVNLAKMLNMRTVAEGVETEAIYRELAGLGCDRGQGYYFSKPLAIEETLEYITEFG